MASQIVDLLICNVPQFTVDATANQVAISGAASPLVQVVTAYDLFQNRDNAIITEIGINLPYQYCQGTGLLQFELGWANADFSDTIARYQGYLPNANEPFQIAALPGLYLQNPQGDLWATRSRLYVTISGNVSMVYQPPSIANGSALAVTAWAKVGHLLPLVAP